MVKLLFFFSSRRRHTRSYGDWSSDVCSSDLRRRRRAASQLHADGAGGGGQDDALVGMLPQAGVALPAVDGVLEVADHREAARGQACRDEIGRASCRERGTRQVVAAALNKNNT